MLFPDTICTGQPVWGRLESRPMTKHKTILCVCLLAVGLMLQGCSVANNAINSVTNVATQTLQTTGGIARTGIQATGAAVATPFTLMAQ